MAHSASDTATYQPSIGLVVGLVWLAIAFQMLWLDWQNTAEVLGDTDDAMRLVQVRELLAGRGWFDLHEPRLQPPIGYDTHWSRLIDGGLAGLFLLFHLFTDTAFAERLMRAIWPLLWLLPAIVGAVALAWRLGGRAAGFVVLLLLLFGLPAFIQFRVGRIDHHNVQITLAMLTVAAAIWADRVRWAAWAAGALSGLAMAIGIEGMPFIAVAGGLFVVRYLVDCNFAPALSRYGQSLAAGTAIFFFISVNPSHWTMTGCDAIAFNSATPAVVAGLALAIAGHRAAHERVLVRCVVIIIAFGLAAAIFLLLEPRCLRGPMAMIDPAVWPIWLSHISEVQPLMATIRENPLSGFGIAGYPIAAIIAAIVLARDQQLRRDSGFIAEVAALLLAVAMTIAAIRGSPYAFWFGMPIVAAALLGLFDWLKLKTLPARALVTIPFSPTLLAWGVIATIEMLGPHDANKDAEAKKDAEAVGACFKMESYAALAQLPKGLIVPEINYGPFLLALTPHSVLAAPYHRVAYGTVTSHRIFAAPPDEARQILGRTGATYVMTCGIRGPKGLSEAETQRSLWKQLKSGNVPDWLEPIPNTGPFGVYRIKP